MTQGSKILVTGATGKVGREVVSGLLDADTDVRALARDPGSAGLPDGVEVVQGDLSRPGTLQTALDGIDAVFLLWPMANAAASAVVDEISSHARRIVYLSSEGVRDGVEGQTDPITQSHADMERLIEQYELGWTFLRPTGFASNTLGWAEGIRTEGIVRAPYGEASRSLIHERDIAAVAVRALSGDGHAGKRHVLSGPGALTQIEQAHTIGEAIGRPVRFEETPPEVARDELTAAFGDASFADGALGVWAGFVTRPEQVTSTVAEIIGRPARTFREWANDHAGDFR